MPLVLDDNVIRSLGHAEISAEPFISLRDEGVSVHLADGAMGELAHQLLEGRFLWQNWLVARDALRRFLDPREPVLLGGRLGLFRAGLRGVMEATSPSEIASAVEYTSNWWAAFMRAEQLADVTAPVQIGNVVVGLSRQAAAHEVAGFKEEWAGSFDTQRIDPDVLTAFQEGLPPGSGDALEQLEAIVQNIGRNLDATTQGRLWPPESLRLDAMIRVYVLLQISSLRQRDPYDAVKHQNDSFDHDLLRYLAYPTAICTRDRGLLKKLRRAKCWQAPWVVEPEQLTSAALRQMIRAIAWPAPPSTREVTSMTP